MQFNFVAVTLAALVASAAAAQNVTVTPPAGGNATNTSRPTPIGSPTGAPEPGAAFHNAVSGGLLGVVVAAGLTLVL